MLSVTIFLSNFSYVCLQYIYYGRHIHIDFAPNIFLRPSYLQQGTVGEPHDLVCLIALSSTVQSSSVNFTWNFTSNDDRVTVIPTTITVTDDSVGIIYTTVIQFDYLMEADEGNYKCTLTIDGNSADSTFQLEIISEYDVYVYTYIYICVYVYTYVCMCIYVHVHFLDLIDVEIR